MYMNYLLRLVNQSSSRDFSLAAIEEAHDTLMRQFKG